MRKFKHHLKHFDWSEALLALLVLTVWIFGLHLLTEMTPKPFQNDGSEAYYEAARERYCEEQAAPDEPVCEDIFESQRLAHERLKQQYLAGERQ